MNISNLLNEVSSRPVLRGMMILILDGFLTAASLILALLLRFEGRLLTPYDHLWPYILAALLGSRLLANILMRLQHWSFRYSGLADGGRIGMAGLLGTGFFILLIYFFHPMLARYGVTGPPRSVVVMELALTTFLMALFRFAPRLLTTYAGDHLRSRSGKTLKTLILGAGGAGESLLRDLQRSQDHNYRVFGFADDSPAKQRVLLGGKPVLGKIDDLPVLIRRHGIEKVLIAIPNLPARRIRDILTMCADMKIRYKILPLSFLYLKDRTAAAMLQDLTPEDLLPREQISLADEKGTSPFAGRSALVTGAAGSIGSEICQQLVKNGIVKLIMSDINENGLYLLQRRLQRDFPDVPLQAEIADIRDRNRLFRLFQHYRPQDVFHAAAHKHVPLMETAPAEAVKNNIQGTRNVAEAARANGAERFVLISTDKAVRPSSVMGASKRVAEMIIHDMAGDSPTRFCAVRFGNVLGSAGSVVPLFKEQIAAGGPLTVTHPDVRRYFMTVSEAVSLVLKTAYGDYGQLCILDMGEQFRILDLARAMITMSGLVPDADIPIVFTGLRPGEKLHEELLTEAEEKTARVNHRILVADWTRLPEEFHQCLEQLASAAAVENHPEIRLILKKMIPSYLNTTGEEVH